MSRMYIVNHWSDAAAYSGEQIGDRLKDSTALHFNRDGSANVELYSEETAATKKKTSVSLKDRILPQSRRVQTLTDQMVELCNEYKAGLHTPEEYTLLLNVISAKRDRAIVLLDKAKNVKPTFEQAEEVVVNQINTAPNQSTAQPIDQQSPITAIKHKSSQIWLECKVFMGYSVIGCLGLMWLAH